MYIFLNPGLLISSNPPDSPPISYPNHRAARNPGCAEQSGPHRCPPCPNLRWLQSQGSPGMPGCATHPFAGHTRIAPLPVPPTRPHARSVGPAIGWYHPFADCRYDRLAPLPIQPTQHMLGFPSRPMAPDHGTTTCRDNRLDIMPA